MERIASLEREILLKADKDKKYRHQVKLDMDECKEAKEKMTVQNEAEKEIMKEKLSALDIISTSYIRGLYDHCLAQFDILNVESGKEIKTKKRNIQSNQVSHVFEMLEKKVESMHIEWDEMLADENDRRKIYGKLNNLTTKNLSDISDFIGRIRSRQVVMMKRSKDEYSQKLINQSLLYENDLTLLRKSLNEKENELSDITLNFEESQETLKETEIDLERRKERSVFYEEQVAVKNKKIESIEEEKINLSNKLEEASILPVLVAFNITIK